MAVRRLLRGYAGWGIRTRAYARGPDDLGPRGICSGIGPAAGPRLSTARHVPVVVFFFSSPTDTPAARASLIALFLLTDLLGLAWQGWNGLVTWHALWRAVVFLPPLIAGIWIGNHHFKKADPAAVRRWVLRVLMLLALVAGIHALLQLT